MLIQNAMAFLDGAFALKDIRIMDGAIVAVGDRLSPASGEETIDFHGDYLTPGFVDVHIHAFMGMDTMQGEQAVRHMSRELKKTGVAAFVATTMSASKEDTLAALRGVASVMKTPEKDGAAVLGAHMEAPFMNAERCGAQMKEFFIEPDLAAFDEMTADVQDCVRIISMAPELPGAMDFIRALSDRGITVSIGHTSADARTVHQAADAGARHVTHTFNAQTPLNHREPGVPGAALSDTRLYAEFIADYVHLHPDILKIAALCKGREKLVLVSDAMEAAGMPDGKYQLGGQDVFVKDGAARLASGVLAGSTLLLHRAVTNMAHVGVPFADAVAMASATPAKCVHAEGYGMLAPGAKGPFNRFDAQYEWIQAIG